MMITECSRSHGIPPVLQDLVFQHFSFPCSRKKAPVLHCSLQLSQDVNVFRSAETATSLYSAHAGLEQAELQHFTIRLSVLP